MEWKKLSEERPGKNQDVLGWSKDEGIKACDVCYYEPHDRLWLNIKQSGCGCCDRSMDGDVWWMPLPEPPRE